MLISIVKLVMLIFDYADNPVTRYSTLSTDFAPAYVKDLLLEWFGISADGG